MSSTKKQVRATEEPICKRDPETGKLIPLPWRRLNQNSAKSKGSAKKVKSMLDLAPLRLTSADFEDQPRRSNKIRKTDDHLLRKDLFNLSPRTSEASHPSKADPICKRDPETGKLIPLPMRWLHQSSTKDKGSEKKVKRVLDLAPLRLTAADFEESPHRSSKIRKTDVHSVRKGLFNVPPKTAQSSRPSLNKRRTLTRRSASSTKVPQKKIQSYELSPLIDMEEFEEEIINKKTVQAYPFRTPSKPSIKFTAGDSKCNLHPEKLNLQQNHPKTEITKSIEHTPNSASSNESEFLEFEKMCVEDSVSKNESPVSSVCNLLEGTVINSTKKDKRKLLGSMTNTQDIINQIENILHENSIAFEKYKTTHEENISKITDLLETDKNEFENLVKSHDTSKNTIKDLISKLKPTSLCTTPKIECNKENTPLNNRRSIRLLNKSPLQARNAKLVVSPAVLRSKDLRKSTLTKNLATKTQQYNIQSPRIQRALNMYNSMRCEMSVLATPKLDRDYLNESPRSANLCRSLSRRVQNQCLLLQDTPIHK